MRTHTLSTTEATEASISDHTTDAVSDELMTDAGAVSAFKAARSQDSVYAEGGARNSLCDRSVQTHFFTSVFSVVESCATRGRMQPPVL
jgi:hypothetical protein